MQRGLLFLLILLAGNIGIAQTGLTKYVNPFIGTGGHGHSYPGATMPHGMVQLSPDTRLEGWDGCGGYHYSDSFIYGFSHTHLSGTGVSDYGDLLIMPMTGDPSPDNKIYGSVFRHNTEKASPGFYRVMLDDDHILAELTATSRAGLHSYTFPASDKSNIILDLKHRDEVLESNIKIVSNTSVEGMRRSRAWAIDQHVYFVMEFSKPFLSNGIWLNDTLQTNSKSASGLNLKAFFSFNSKANEKILVRVGISSVSIEGARKNLAAEIKGFSFDAIKQKATLAWQKELNRIQVTGGSSDQRTIFYTALYHSMIVPHLNMDVDRSYRGRDNKIHTADGFTNYSVFSLWDTYRAAHPLYTIIDRQRTRDYINTFLAQYKQGGRLPVWELSSNETDCMIGYHSVPVIVDAAIKGISGFDKTLALQAMKKSANWNHLGLPALIDHGFIDHDDEHENVSKTLEYAYDDWCISEFAKMLGKKNDQQEFAKRAQYYKNLLDPVTGFIMPRKNGNWLQPFDPREVNNNYTEANGWQYNFYVPHDMDGYTKIIGGKQRLEAKLDSLFSVSSETTGRVQADITGLIGQYAHGNEPSHHIAYLYSFAGKPYKTQKLVGRIMSDMYHNRPDGLSGNEDCGQMSAWYVLSALGFYPVTPASGEYVFGLPLFDKVVINLENGKKFTIHNRAIQIKNNPVNKDGRNSYRTEQYIAAINLNKKPFKQWYFNHSYLASGGELEFVMSDAQQLLTGWKYPSTKIFADEIVPNPLIKGGEISLKVKK